jgi:hypothetical protein
MTNGTSEGWRYLSEIREISGNGWKVPDRRINQEQPIGFKQREGNLPQYLCRRILHKVEGSGNTSCRKLSVDLVSLIDRAEYIWIRGGKLGKVYKEGFMDLKSPPRNQLISSIPVRYQSAFLPVSFHR